MYLLGRLDNFLDCFKLHCKHVKHVSSTYVIHYKIILVKKKQCFGVKKFRSSILTEVIILYVWNFEPRLFEIANSNTSLHFRYNIKLFEFIGFIFGFNFVSFILHSSILYLTNNAFLMFVVLSSYVDQHISVKKRWVIGQISKFYRKKKHQRDKPFQK